MFNDVDRTFLRAMIPHHRQGIQMAELAADAGSEEVRELAGKMVEDQRPEATEMEQLASEAGLSSVDLQPEPAKQRAMSDLVQDQQAMPAMMFDRSFVAQTITHHLGGIDLAEMQLAGGEHPRLRQMAQTMRDEQMEDVRRFTDVLEAISDEGTMGQMKRAMD